MFTGNQMQNGLYGDTYVNHSFLIAPFHFKGSCGQRLLSLITCWDLADGLPQLRSQWQELRMKRLSVLACVSSYWWSLLRVRPCHSYDKALLLLVLLLIKFLIVRLFSK